MKRTIMSVVIVVAAMVLILLMNKRAKTPRPNWPPNIHVRIRTGGSGE
jgi:hypothetical protein